MPSAIDAHKQYPNSPHIYRQNRQNLQTSDTEESEGARFGVGEIGLRRDRGQKRCLQSQRREIEFWEGQVRSEEIDSPKAAQNGPRTHNILSWLGQASIVSIIFLWA